MRGDDLGSRNLGSQITIVERLNGRLVVPVDDLSIGLHSVHQKHLTVSFTQREPNSQKLNSKAMSTGTTDASCHGDGTETSFRRALIKVSPDPPIPHDKPPSARFNAG